MAPVLPRTHITSSPFIRLLTEFDSTHAPDGKLTFAERLSQWLDWTDAIALSAALNEAPSAAAPTPSPRASASSGGDVFTDFARVRAELTRSITTDAFTTDSPEPPEFAPYRRHYVAQQRAMTERISPLRVNIRMALSKQSPRLSRLAALDAVLDDALAARERHLLSHVPRLLEARFVRLHPAHREQDMRKLLLAELDLRLQPLDGMVAALRHDAMESS